MRKGLIPKEFIFKRIADLRKQKGYSKAKLSDKAGLRRTYLFEIESGRFKKPLPTDVLGKIITALGVTEEQFFSDEKPRWNTPKPVDRNVEAVQTEDAIVKVPIFGDIPAGFPNWTEGVVDAIDFADGFPRDKALNAFALRVMGDSLHPHYQHRDVVFLKPLNIFLPIKDPERLTPRATFDALKGRVVAVLVNNEATLKKLDITPDDRLPGDYFLHLRPLNPAYPDITIQPEDEVHFQGVVYRLMREMG